MKLTLVFTTQEGAIIFCRSKPPKNNLTQSELEDYADGRMDYREKGYNFIGAFRGHIEPYHTETEFTL